ncbi:HAUS augmin-like complex subunit 4 isoform X2 [Rhopilema esculentum]|uniref:HAUS augmin-like complex subunit 4 isoform X2 n=1 Tax=Rhopilema esculentum TaxID=499914 RepID=UPI0031D856F3
MEGKISKYPKFEELMEMLGSVVNEDCISRDAAEDLNEATNQLQEVKKVYFQREMILNIIKDILLDKFVKREEGKINPEDKQAYAVLEESVRTAEAIHFIKMCWTDDKPYNSNLFGLTDAKLNNRAKKKQKVKHTIQQYFIPDIEQRLKQKCMDLIRLWDSNTESESDGLALAKAGNLPVLVEKELSRISGEEKKIRKEKAIHQELLLRYKEALKDCIENLEGLLKTRILESSAESTRTTVEWLGTKCEAMQLKIKVLQLQLLKDTYNPDTIPALRQIRDSLNTALKDSKKELIKLEQTLKVYESIGSGFDSLVKEYAQLTAEIDNRKWALSELKRAQGHENR